MRFFFTASIHGKKQFEQNYRVIQHEVERLGHEVDAANVLEQSVETMKALSEQERVAYNREIMNCIKNADAILIETSYPSTSIGYNMALAVQLGKPVIAFYSGAEEPHLLKTLEKISDRFQIIRYSNLDQLKDEIPAALAFAAETQNVRFNFFISPAQSHYLDWVARNKKISRSVYLRDLIDRNMKDDSNDDILN